MNSRQWVAVAAGLVAAAGPAPAQFVPGFRPGLYYTTPFGSVGLRYNYSQFVSYPVVNPYTGQSTRVQFGFSYSGAVPFGLYAQNAYYTNVLARQYAPYLGNSYLSGGVGSYAGANPVVQEQLRQFAAARPAAARPGPDADPRRQMEFDRGAAEFVRPPDAVVLDPALVRPAEEQVITGEVLNRLADAINGLSGKGAKADSPLFPSELLARVSFDGSAAADVIQMIRAGRLDFPPAFAGPGLDAARTDVATPAGVVLEAVAAGRRPATDVTDRLSAAVKKARADVAPAVRDLPPGPAGEVVRFLNALDALAKSGRDFARGNVYPTKWTTVGATAAELIAHMNQFQLRFGPAPTGNEDAYFALHRGLVDYYAALSQPRK